MKRTVHHFTTRESACDFMFSLLAPVIGRDKVQPELCKFGPHDYRVTVYSFN